MSNFGMTLLLTLLTILCRTDVYYQVINAPNQIADYPLYEKVTNTSTPIFKKLDARCKTPNRISFSVFKHPWNDYYLLLWSRSEKNSMGVTIAQSYWKIISDKNGTRTECKGLFSPSHKYEGVTYRAWDSHVQASIQRMYYYENDKKGNVWTVHNLLASEKQLNHKLARALQENQEISQKLNATVIQKDTQIMYLNQSRNVNKISCAHAQLIKTLNASVIDKDNQIKIANNQITALNKSNHKMSEGFLKLYTKYNATIFDKKSQIKNASHFERKIFAFVIMIMVSVCIVSHVFSYLCFKRRMHRLQEMQRLLVGRNKLSIVNECRNKGIIVNNNNNTHEGGGNVKRYWKPEQFNNMLINAPGVQNAVIDDILSDMATEEGLNQKQSSCNNIEDDMLDGTPVTS